MIPGGLTEKRPYEKYPEVSEMNRKTYEEWKKLSTKEKDELSRSINSQQRKQKLGDKKLQREINDIKEILGKAKLPVPAKYRQSETKKLEELNKNMKPVFRKKTASKKAKRCKCK